MKNLLSCACICAILTGFTSCTKETPDETGNASTANLVFKFKFDPTQQRLNNIGQPASMPAGNAGLDAVMNTMSAHYLELAPGAFTMLGKGAVLYKAEETSTGGSAAIDFSKAKMAGDGQVFLSVPIKDVPKGEYEYLRISLAYQNFDVKMYLDTVLTVGGTSVPYTADIPATVAGFIGYNTYISDFTVKTKKISVNGNREQGFLGFECSPTIFGTTYTFVNSGQCPRGATTVVNPLFASSPIPAGSCLVTGAFNGGKLTITGSETKDIVVIASLSVNKSFEWKDTNGNGKWDATKGEAVVDMGIRGLIPTVQ